MPKVLIADDVHPDCAEILRKAGIDVDSRGKMTGDEVKAIIGEYDGLIVRSAVKVNKDIIEAGSRLKIIGRAGIGVDNVDKEAASRKGVIVMNCPQGNVASAAEHAFALIMANARNIAPADASLRAGEWKRSKYLGVELEGKTLGVVGLGNIGGQVALYARPFGMKVVAYDPLLVKERAEVLGVEMAEFDRLLEVADYITVHVPLTDRTRRLFGAAQFKKMKKTARIINTSRGGVIDEKALHEALSTKEIAGAALDVYESEPPPKDHPLFTLENITLTPHLAASTEEAQVKVAILIAEQFVDFFKTGAVRNAVNVRSLADPTLTPYLQLAEDLGGLAAQAAGGRVKSISVTYGGQIGGFDVDPVTQSAVSGALRPSLGDDINVVSARFVAKDAGIQVVEEKKKDARQFKSLITVRVETESGRRDVAGTVFEGGQPRIVRIDNLDIDLKPSRHMLCIQYQDVPGMVGKIGSILGRAAINIARMEVARIERGKQAMIILTVDDPVPDKVVEEIRKTVPIYDIRVVTLP